jgi:hypothetical protein
MSKGRFNEKHRFSNLLLCQLIQLLIPNYRVSRNTAQPASINTVTISKTYVDTTQTKPRRRENPEIQDNVYQSDKCQDDRY